MKAGLRMVVFTMFQRSKKITAPATCEVRLWWWGWRRWCCCYFCLRWRCWGRFRGNSAFQRKHEYFDKIWKNFKFWNFNHTYITLPKLPTIFTLPTRLMKYVVSSKKVICFLVRFYRSLVLQGRFYDFFILFSFVAIIHVSSLKKTITTTTTIATTINTTLISSERQKSFFI